LTPADCCPVASDSQNASSLEFGISSSSLHLSCIHHAKLVRYGVLLAQQVEDVIIACIPTDSPPSEQSSIRDEKDRRQAMAQYGSYGFAGKPVSSPSARTKMARRHIASTNFITLFILGLVADGSAASKSV
jgi:hypothetical protein